MPTQASDAKQIFLQAVEEYTPDQWPRYLDEACQGNAQLRARVLALLKAHSQPNRVLDNTGIVVPVPQLPISEAIGTIIGPYKLVEQIGEGGMGIVFAAEQQEPVRRDVALKIIKPGMDTREVVARFETERQALALMDHPNIARVFDVGATASGRPFFAMELIKGTPINEYCDQNELAFENRLELFVRVCQAIQHAHQKGVIHRDIKPTNVLVATHDGLPTVKVIDFGVAKAINRELTAKTFFTNHASMLGTPQYMSPEQAEMGGRNVDTRSDIYSLGVLLYELLTGTTPLQIERLRDAGYAEVQRMIREEEPQRPSLRLSTLGPHSSIVARKRSVDPVRLRNSVQGELDWIVIKTLEKEPARRYDSASSLADDVQRFLSGEPVEAYPPTAMYRLRKTAARHRAAVALAAAVVLSLLLGLLGTSLGMFAAVGARRQAEEEAERYRRLFYVADVGSAQQAWEQHDVNRTMRLLRSHIPNAGQTDLRGFEWFYLQRLCQQARGVPTIEYRGESAHSVAVSEKGELAVAFGGWIRLYRVSDHAFLDSYPCKSSDAVVTSETDEGPVYFAFPFVAMTRNGNRLAYPDKDPEVLLVRDRTTGTVTPIPERHRGAVRAASFSADGKWLATAGEDGAVKVWNAATLTKLREHQSHSALIWSVAFSPSGHIIASGSADNTVSLWNIQSGAVETLTGHFTTPSMMDGVFSVAFSPDGSRLVSGGADRTVRLWDVKTARPIVVFSGHSDEVRSVAFSPDGTTVASGGRDHSVRLWDVTTRREKCVLRSHQSIVQSLSFTFDGNQLITVCFQGTIRFWDREHMTGRDVLWMARPVVDVAISADGSVIAAVEQQSRQVRLWQFQADKDEPLTDTIELDEIADAVAMAADGGLAIACRSGAVEVWDLHTRQRFRTLENDIGFGPTGDKAFLYSDDGQLLAMGCGDGSNRVWNMETGDSYVLKRGESEVRSMAFAVDGSTLVSATRDRRLTVWDLATRRHAELGAHGGPLESVAVAPDGKTVVSGGEDCMQLWDVQSGELRETLKAGRGHQGATFLDATTVITCDADGRLRLWDIDRGILRFELTGHRGGVWHLDASADGETVVSGGWDGSVRIWRAPREFEAAIRTGA